MPIDTLSQKEDLLRIPMRSIKGLDRDISSFLQSADYQPGFPIDPAAWNQETLEALYFLQPLIVVERGKPRRKETSVDETAGGNLNETGSPASINTESESAAIGGSEYQVVGSVLAWALAEELLAPDDLIMVRCIRAARVSKADKMCLLSAELLAIPCLHWLGKGAPRIRQRLWETLSEAGFNPLSGAQLSDYKCATRATYR